MIIERCTQKVIGTYEEAVALEKKYDALEAKLGNIPPKRRYSPLFSGLPMGTYIWEREWPNLTAIEKYQQAIPEDAEWAAIFEETRKIFTEGIFELFEVITLPE